MASRFHPTENPRQQSRQDTCTNAPDPHILRTSQTLQAKAEIPAARPDSEDAAPRKRRLYTVLQDRYG
ncbi:hypothetical protein [Neptunicoccus sediminis]|uniref:hypothetical protein n=1 Tax=Neptunicoccus sediminis TaxID=1892596 RepID=UPI000845EE21|nr:hypothetical protein [Neptunicoccus sediminis]